MISFYPVTMVHEDLTDMDYWESLPSGYKFDLYQPGDEVEWSRLQSTTDSFPTETEAFAHFQKEFGSVTDELKNRCFFLTTDKHQKIGSATAWFRADRFDDRYGRLHWIVIHPDFRGRGLGRELIRFTMKELNRLYTKAYLTSQTTSYPAINIYLDFGFKPWIEGDQDKKAWDLLRDLLRHPALL